MTAVAIRKADEADADAVASILSGWIDRTDWMPRIHTLAGDHAFVSHLLQRGGVRVAVAAHGIEGFISQQSEEIDALYVSNCRQGIGSALLSDAKERCQRLSLWTFAANEGARRFYARHGFVEVGATDGDNDETLPDVRLLWEVKTNG